MIHPSTPPPPPPPESPPGFLARSSRRVLTWAFRILLRDAFYFVLIYGLLAGSLWVAWRMASRAMGWK